MDYKVPVGVYLHMDIKMEEFPVMPVYIHSQNAEMGINDLYWVTNVESLVLLPEMSYYDILLRHEFDLSINDCNDEPSYNVFECIFKWGQMVYQNVSIFKKLESCQEVTKGNLVEGR